MQEAERLGLYALRRLECSKQKDWDFMCLGAYSAASRKSCCDKIHLSRLLLGLLHLLHLTPQGTYQMQ